MTRRAAPPLGHGQTRDRAIILPLIGLALLTPPLGGIFQLDLKIAGVPFTLIYLFAVWAALIACAWALSRRLGSGEPASAQETGTSARVTGADTTL